MVKKLITTIWIILFIACQNKSNQELPSIEYNVRLFASQKLSQVSINCENPHFKVYLANKSQRIINFAQINVYYQNDKLMIIHQMDTILGIDSIITSNPTKVEVKSDQSRRVFTGRIKLYTVEQQLGIIGSYDTEELVAAITAGELSDGFQLQARAAQAIVIRTWIQSNIKRHLNKYYQFCDLTHCGVMSSHNPDYEAAKLTTNLILTRSGQPIEVYYCSSTGEPFDSSYSSHAPDFNWNSMIAWTDLTSFLPIEPKSRTIAVTDSTSTGKINKIQIGNAEFGIDYFRSIVGRKLGWNVLPGVYFRISNFNQDSIYFTGKGKGLGVGFSQWGAYYRALDGQDFKQILADYFPQAEITKLTNY
jgi:peptidoglycan hydrolase-like amidase